VTRSDPSLRVTSSCAIALDELRWEFTGSGGPGGQHANTANTKAIVVFDVRASRSLSESQRARLSERLGTEVRVAVNTTRSQSRNRDLALERLRRRLAEALHRDPPRRPTRPTRAAQQRRLEAKRHRGQTKHQRRHPDATD
jgi:ribosome-associated protein